MARVSPVLELHHWVLQTVQDVAVIVDPFTGMASAVADPDEPIGVQVGCIHCFVPLGDGTATTLCKGDPSMLP